MAFLRSVSRYNSLVSRSFHSISSSQHANCDIQSRVVRAEWLACNRHFGNFRSSSTTDQKPMAGTNVTMNATMATTAAATSPSQRDPLDVSFNDPIAAFKSKTTWELVRAYFVYLICSSEYLVENNMKVNGAIKIHKKLIFMQSACMSHVACARARRT